MAFNSSRLPDSWCRILFVPNASKSTSVYYQVNLTVSVVTSLLAPTAVVGNALIMAAIWKKPSMRTPSYVLLAGLAFTDFCTGLLSQPFFVIYRVAELTGNIKLFCNIGVIAEIVGSYFSSLTVIVMTIIAVERWLHMSRRSLLTVRRVVIIYIMFVVLLIVFFSCGLYGRYYMSELVSVTFVIFLLGAVLCFVLHIFAYFKVFQIVREHQSQVQTNQNAIDLKRYKKSLFTILYILAIFFLSYVPLVCCLLVVFIMEKFENESSSAAINACVAVVYSSSFVNPLLYYWRIKEIRDSARGIVTNFCCTPNGEES
ncbi:putative G-protein coupled receptor 45 [Oculina patagonica]